ncbi:BamA/TamA family outer membrane protein [Ramlibacter tataouinensis]|uniref:autotransporter assembly complex protein TamA n=1 Tax=Ramlibacter tataouinensis TaxID=94132 RepID=UPI0022F39538|nr:BamA/TamA family outer membrane protein [Ramlibacter tataouinensis]WBY03099.1 BamA/TamA family outer membrane protein [Ramlibacter tataouinensis]
MKPGLRARALRWWIGALGAGLLAAAAFAQQGPARPAFNLDVRAPGPVKELLERHLELQRYRQVADLDDAELARLLRLAERDARELLATLGYFAPRLDIRREPAAAGGVPLVVLAVEPGPPTTIAEVDIAFQGDIATSTDPDAVLQRGQIRERWSLPAGSRFTQEGWADAKSGAQRELVARRYPAGRIGFSRADIDAATQRARLGLRLDSGPLFRLGPMQVSGVERYDPVLAPRLARLPPGTVYDQDRIQRAQLRLAGSGYFDSAFIYVDPAGDPAAAPVQVNVREAPLKKLVLGLGLSTDTGPRASVEYTHNRLPGLGWRAVNKLQLDRKAPFVSSELSAIPGEDGWRWGVSARAERLDDDQLVTHSQTLRVGRTRSEDHIERNVYLQFDRSSVRAEVGAPPPVDTGDGTALSANYIWRGRYFDQEPYPSRGYAIGAELGAGVTLVGSRSPFQRTVLRWLQIHPLERGRLQWRAEGGAVLASAQARVPSTQLFRTGGDTSVRGYGFRDIGVQQPGGLVGPGRLLAVGSLEWQRPIRRGDVPTDFEGVLFVDAGAVADHVSDLKPAVGVGAGVRYRSPLGPLQVDLAYGVDARRLRLHINIASTF